MILVVSDLWLPFPGGAERLIMNLSRDLVRRGEQVAVVTGYYEAQPFDGPQLIERMSLPADQEGADRLAAFIEGCKPSLILTHHYWAFEFEETICAAGVPVVQVVLNGRRLACAAMAVFISEFVRQQEWMGSHAQDMTIVPPAFDDVRAESHGDKIGMIKPLHHKGIDLFYDIARALPDREFLVLRGEWQDIETIVELPNVEFMEPVADIRDFYKRVRVVLVPSLSEDAGTVGQECAVNGIPCVSSDVGGLPETNAGGVLVPDRNVESWGAVIQALDSSIYYDTVVAMQRAHTPTDQRPLLDEFARRVHLLQQ